MSLRLESRLLQMCLLLRDYELDLFYIPLLVLNLLVRLIALLFLRLGLRQLHQWDDRSQGFHRGDLSRAPPDSQIFPLRLFLQNEDPRRLGFRASAAASLVARIEVRSFAALLKLAQLVCCPIPLTQIGFSVVFLAFLSDTNSIADDPVQRDEQSNSFIGGTIFLEFKTSS